MSSSKSLFLIPAFIASGIAGAQTLTCPEKIETSSTLASTAPEWTASVDTRPNPYSRLSVTSGRPEEEAYLVPDSNTKSQMTWIVPAGQQYWAVCHYLNSNIRLVQQVPPGVGQCTLRSRPIGAKATYPDNKLVCK